MIRNGRYTISSPLGGHRTLRVSTQGADAKFAPNRRIVSRYEVVDADADRVVFSIYVGEYENPTRRRARALAATLNAAAIDAANVEESAKRNRCERTAGRQSAALYAMVAEASVAANKLLRTLLKGQ